MPDFPQSQGSPDDLISIARQAGYLPDPRAAYDPGSQDEPRQSVQDFAAQTGAQIPDSETPPGQVPAPTGPSKVGVSTSGINLAKAPAVDSYVDPALKKQYAGIDADVAREEQKLVSPLQQAREEGKAAVVQGAQAQGQYDLAEGREARIMSDLSTSMAADEAKINEHYIAESNQSKADYMAALADFRGSRVDPSALWKQMGKGQQIGMLVSAFVQDFLGVKGIHISAMDTFNKAIDRNIDAQVLAIKTKGEVAEGFKSLWQMQRAQAASDAEGRARVRGFVLDAAKQAVVSHMAQYKSALSDAQGQAALAKLDEEFGKNLVDVYKHIDTNRIQMREQAIQVFGEKLKAMMEQRKIDLERDKMSAAKNQITNPLAGKLVDPWTGKYAYQLKPTYLGQKPEDMAKDAMGIQKDLGKAKALDDKFVELAELAKKMGPIPAEFYAKTRWASTYQKAYAGIRQDIAQIITRNTDGRVNWNEIEGQMVGIPENLMEAQYDLPALIECKRRGVINGVGLQLQGLTDDLDPNDPARGIGGASQGGVFAAKMAADRGVNPRQPSHSELMTQVASGKASSYYTPAGKQPLAKPAADAQEAVGEFARLHPQAFAQTRDKAEKATDEGTPVKGEAANYPVFAWEEGLNELKLKAEKGDKDALGQLKLTASSYLGPMGSEDSEPDAIFAAMLLMDLYQQDPNKFENPTTKSERFNPTGGFKETARDK